MAVDDILLTSEYFDIEGIELTSEEVNSILSSIDRTVLESYSTDALNQLQSLLQEIDPILIDKTDGIAAKLSKNEENSILLSSEIESGESILTDISDLNKILTFDQIQQSENLLSFVENTTSIILLDSAETIELQYRKSQISRVKDDLIEQKNTLNFLRSELENIQLIINQIIEERA